MHFDCGRLFAVGHRTKQLGRALQKLQRRFRNRAGIGSTVFAVDTAFVPKAEQSAAALAGLSAIGDEGTVERLFPDFEKEEKAYYQRTKMFPIMHPVVIKKEILDRDPWVATSLYEALLASRRAYNEFMEQPHRLSFAWGRSYLEEERKFFGKDPFYQGFKENYNDVQNLIKFADQQGMLGRKLTVEELFTENTQNT